LSALRVIGDGFLVGPAGASNTPSKVREVRLGDVDTEWPDLAAAVSGDRN